MDFKINELKEKEYFSEDSLNEAKTVEVYVTEEELYPVIMIHDEKELPGYGDKVEIDEALLKKYKKAYDEFRKMSSQLRASLKKNNK